MLYTWYSSGTSVSGGGGGGNSTARGPERACTASDECCGVAAECAINLGAGMLNIRSGSVSASEDTSTRPAGSGSVLSEPSGRTYKCVVDLLPCGGAAGAGLGGCEGTRAPEDAGRRSRSCKPRPTPDCGTTYHGTPCSCPLCRELMRRVNLFLRRFSSGNRDAQLEPAGARVQDHRTAIVWADGWVGGVARPVLYNTKRTSCKLTGRQATWQPLPVCPQCANLAHAFWRFDRLSRAVSPWRRFRRQCRLSLSRCQLRCRMCQPRR